MMNMKTITPTWLTFLFAVLLCICNDGLSAGNASFYKVPLVCGAAPHIGCGSRIKPFFMDTEKEPSIKESWTNRQGTVLAFVWNGEASIAEQENVLRPLFEKHGIEAELVSDTTEQGKLHESLANEKDQWLEGMEVDRLSLEEAGVIAQSLTQFAVDAKLINAEENASIRSELEAYFKKELVIVRTEDELRAYETQERWRRDGFAIYEKHIGKKRAEKVSKYYKKHAIEYMDDESCCSEEGTDHCCEKKPEKSLKSKITCPHCGHVATEKMPTDVCLLSYTCKKCDTELRNQEGDCCVFCSYGDHKCPSKQE
jgi:hypothetical protein